MSAEIFNENDQVWAGDRRDLEEKLASYYGIESDGRGVRGIWIQGDYHHEETGVYHYDVLTYFDGEEEHFIADDVPMFGHGPSGAVGMDRESLPPKERVREVVEATEGGESA